MARLKQKARKTTTADKGKVMRQSLASNKGLKALKKPAEKPVVKEEPQSQPTKVGPVGTKKVKKEVKREPARTTPVKKMAVKGKKRTGKPDPLRVKRRVKRGVVALR